VVSTQTHPDFDPRAPGQPEQEVLDVDLRDRDLRQREIVPPEKLAACHAVVIGVGAIGRQVAVQLAAVGIPHLTLIDHDGVGVENLAPQAYWPRDIGRAKVDATGDLCKRIHPHCRVGPLAERFRRSTVKSLAAFSCDQNPPVVFGCVDSILTRAVIFEAVKSAAALFVDGRMSAEVIRVLAASHPATDAYYPTTLFAAEQAYVGSCTARSTVYTAAIAAGLMIAQFTKWLRGLPLERDLSFNLLCAELAVR
jgi:sulfur carrier protein ThiS adenylyltransferase